MAKCTQYNIWDKVFQWLAAGLLFSPVSPTNKTDRQDITEILLKLAINTITLTPNPFSPHCELNNCYIVSVSQITTDMMVITETFVCTKYLYYYDGVDTSAGELYISPLYKSIILLVVSTDMVYKMYLLMKFTVPK